jgi:hypothetical protein
VHIEPVEIYSDATNAAIMRHPGRKFPGLLVQGDTLSNLSHRASEVYERLGQTVDEESRWALFVLCDDLRSFLSHYKNTLEGHGINLPFHNGIPPKPNPPAAR